MFAQVLCELACVVDDGARARRWLAVADQHALIDHDWLEFHPLLAPLREGLVVRGAAGPRPRAHRRDLG